MVLNNIDYHICDTCNLKCVSCNHFSPLADSPNLKTVNDAERDFDVLGRFSDKFNTLTILGGEALLNNETKEILELASTRFPNRVKLITNGLLIYRLHELKDTIRENQIQLVVTEYPFKDGWKEHYGMIRWEFPEATFYDFRVEHGFLKNHLSKERTGLSDDSLMRCDKRLKCCNYVDGRLYICHYAAFLPFLNRVADTEYGNDDAFIDLRVCTDDEFDAFFENAVPDICRHCLYVTKTYEEHEKQPWRRSELDPSEWISETPIYKEYMDTSDTAVVNGKRCSRRDLLSKIREAISRKGKCQGKEAAVPEKDDTYEYEQIKDAIKDAKVSDEGIWLSTGDLWRIDEVAIRNALKAMRNRDDGVSFIMAQCFIGWRMLIQEIAELAREKNDSNDKNQEVCSEKTK